MSFKYIPVQIKIDGSKGFGKWFAHAMTFNHITTAQLCDEISHSTTVTESDVRAVFAELKVAMHDHLLNNQSVKVDGLGTFSVSLSSNLADTKESFKATNIKGASVNFRPETAVMPQAVTDSTGKSRKVRIKQLLNGITFEEYKGPGTKAATEKPNTEG